MGQDGLRVRKQNTNKGHALLCTVPVLSLRGRPGPRSVEGGLRHSRGTQAEEGAALASVGPLPRDSLVTGRLPWGIARSCGSGPRGKRGCEGWRGEKESGGGAENLLPAFGRQDRLG